MSTRALLSAVLFSLGTAAVEAQQWVVLDGPSLPSRGAVYDARRGRAVAFGAEGGTWEYEGTLALRRMVAGAVPARSGAGMVYDSTRGVVLMFGGTATAPLGDTWVLSGNVWQQQSFATLTPPRRIMHGMAFDSWRNQVVLFGGQDPGRAAFLDTWENDGTQWFQRQPATLPYPFLGPRMAFDSGRGVTVMVTATDPLSVWEWDGTDWRARTPAGPAPSQRYSSALAYDPVRQRTVMVGGNNNGDQVWEWDGSAWSMPAVLPFALLDPAMYFDTQRGVMVILGGRIGDVTQDAAWTWDGITFASLWANRRPAMRFGSTWIHDPVRHRTVMFGGITATSTETWEWDGEAWIRHTPANSPPPRQNAGTCFDPVAGVCLLFGGTLGNTVLHDFWHWDGSNWTQITAPGGPTTPFPALAWDPVRGEVIAFGCSISAGPPPTWRWNGVAWTAAGPTSGPGSGPLARTQSALAFDPVRGRMVLFGGGLAIVPVFSLSNDTWEWDGSTWQQMNPVQSPPALGGVSMVHDPVRGRMLLLGAQATLPNTFEAWEYDGTTWTQLGTWFDFLLQNPKVVWDPQRQRAVLFDGSNVQELSFGPLAAADPLGSGCGAPPPLLSVRTRPRPGRSDFGLELSTRPGLPSLFALGLTSANTPLGNGCTLLVQQVMATTFVLANGNGLAIQPIPLPPNQALRGLVLYGQAGALDPAAPGGLAVSQSLRITVGD